MTLEELRSKLEEELKNVKLNLQALNELKAQNIQLKKEYEESQIELSKSKKYNLIMLIISLVSVAIAVASFVVAIVK